MNEQLPYESFLTSKLEQIPLPDEQMAWEDMASRLDEDKKRRIIPFWLNGCVGWGLLALLVTGLAWWIFRPDHWFETGTKNKQVTTTRKTKDTSQMNDPVTPADNTDTRPPAKTDSLAKDNRTDSIITLNLNKPSKNEDVQVNPSPNYISSGGQGKKGTGMIERKKPLISQNKNESTIAKNNPDKSDDPGNIQKTDKPTYPSQKDEGSEQRQTGDSLAGPDKKRVSEPDTSGNQDNVKPAGDSVTVTKKDSVDNVLKQDSAVSVIKEDSSRKRPLTLSAGLGVYQQIPIGGQTMVPYNSLGRKGTLMDYLPSLIFRVNKEEKWFFQSEFRYGAPQYNKELVYKRQTDTNQVTQKVEITSTRLQKTYYHQLPLTFNYYVLPGLSIGGGVSWNRFNSAVSERDVVIRDLGTGLDTSFTPPQVFRVRRADSNFVKSYWQAVFETSYKRNRFSAGLRYSFGLKPFITFTLPGGLQQEEKNSSLQLFIRYELWRQKK